MGGKGKKTAVRDLDEIRAMIFQTGPINPSKSNPTPPLLRRSTCRLLFAALSSGPFSKKVALMADSLAMATFCPQCHLGGILNGLQREYWLNRKNIWPGPTELVTTF